MTPITIPVAAGEARYDVLLGDGLLSELGDILAARCPASRYAIVADSTVAPLYAQRAAVALAAAAPAAVVTFPAGEWNKSRESWASVTDQLLALGLDRESAVVALGGGVTGDLAGFVAATYLRGIRYANVPTTLLAMVDSAVGGKTGVDTPHGKNLVGAFHQPRAVIADVATLGSLPPNQVAAGMAEALKHGVIADPDYLSSLTANAERVRSRDPETLVAVVRRSVEIKADVVADDAQETGRRAVLNFGHTIAHALEATLGYELLHGEAVAIGMLAEARLGERLGVTAPEVTSAIQHALVTYRLPSAPPSTPDTQRMLDVLERDKKARDGSVRFALPATLGTMARGAAGEWTIPAPPDAITEVLQALE